MEQKKTKKESQLDVIARHVDVIDRNVAEMRSTMVTKEDAKSFATKDEMNAGFARIEEKLREKASRDDIFELEAKLIGDTGAITKVEQKHYQSHAQRITRLEKAVFQKATV